MLKEKNPQMISGVIRELQKKLKENETPSSQCFIFLLNLIIDDIFYNISGDNGYNDSMYEVRDVLFKQIGETLIEISSKVESVGESEIYNSFCELTNVYIESLNKINMEFKKEGYDYVAN
ncbi:MAG: hypothetical protein C4557_04390 [Anaerolineaceae bacterium]|nr:MAG: hypothetical protein C4557_04390 [Anaerolineaceae bacterium]